MSVWTDVLERDEGRCFKCGDIVLDVPHSIHHRQLKGMGRGSGKDVPENLITLCGTGTTGCHEQVHAQPKSVGMAGGWIVSRYSNPAEVPVRHWAKGDVWLTPDLRMVTQAEMEASG